MSTRLTIKSRREILGKLLNIAFTKRTQADQAARVHMYKLLYEDYHRKHLETMANLPDEYMPKLKPALTVLVPKRQAVVLPAPHGGMRGSAGYDNEGVYTSSNRFSLEQLASRHTAAMMKKLQAQIDKSVALAEEMAKFKSDTVAILDSVTTTKRLYEIWPELKEFDAIPKEVPRAKLPAPITADLTRVLRLGKGNG